MIEHRWFLFVLVCLPAAGLHSQEPPDAGAARSSRKDKASVSKERPEEPEPPGDDEPAEIAGESVETGETRKSKDKRSRTSGVDVSDLDKRVRKLEKDAEARVEGLGVVSDQLLTPGGAKFRIGGKAEMLFIDSQSEDSAVLGSTENADPHLEIERLRLEPEFDVGRGMLLRGQIDFKPLEGETILKEMAFHHEALPWDWLESDFRVGLQDRFFRPSRPTKIYPLAGNTFWRDETAGAIWRLGLGHADATTMPPDPGGPQIPPGQLQLFASLGNGPRLDANESGADKADFNDIVHDDRGLEDNLGLREVGLGAGYENDMGAPGRVEALAFYVDDRLADASLTYLNQELTVRNVATGTPLAGYGDSRSRRSERYGANFEYFLPASTLFGPAETIRRNDGLQLQAEWIRGRDGELTRTAWTVHAAYRYSFPQRLLFDRYFRSVEPIVRYGELRNDVSATPLLPATWDRRQILVGLLIEVTGDIQVNVEYVFQLEKTGSQSGVGAPKSVDNNELLIDFIVGF